MLTRQLETLDPNNLRRCELGHAGADKAGAQAKSLSGASLLLHAVHVGILLLNAVATERYRVYFSPKLAKAPHISNRKHRDEPHLNSQSSSRLVPCPLPTPATESR
jgi:hypothetical protein